MRAKLFTKIASLSIGTADAFGRSQGTSKLLQLEVESTRRAVSTGSDWWRHSSQHKRKYSNRMSFEVMLKEHSKQPPRIPLRRYPFDFA